MDKVTPKADIYKANLDRAAPLLKQLRASGISHMIDGKSVPSISGETFETKSPVDGSVLATAARGSAEDIDRAATAASLAFKSWRDMSASMRKVFGPFLTVIPFRDEKDAIEIANDVNYGLTGYVWTGYMGRALRVADALEAGMIWLNSENVRHLPTPFGGMKASGIGRDGGDYSFDFYMETKHVSLARGTHKIQKLGI
jgi:5-carboxymethyl-2-hydroxymuconic-semialdehyde dehydrogenase